jgi:curli biogenesis system outer membrane secretion channel CsgG
MIRVRDILRSSAGVALSVGALLGTHAGASADAKATIAVLDFSTVGLTNSWWGSFQPGVALSDLVTDQLVNGHRFNVVERKKLDAVMTEHKLSTDGEVAPATYVQSGRLTGARYIVTGNILQFEKTGQSGGGGALGGFVRGIPAIGAVAGSMKTEKVTLRVQVHVVDSTTGSIVQSFEGEKTESGTSWTGGGLGGGITSSFAGFGAGSYGSETFTSSTMGKLVNDEAGEITGKFDPSLFADAPVAALNGRIISADSFGIILNIGSSKGVSVGMYFDVAKERQIKDPDSGKMLTVTASTAKLQITQVNADSSVATRISGVVAVGEKANQSTP